MLTVAFFGNDLFHWLVNPWTIVGTLCSLVLLAGYGRFFLSNALPKGKFSKKTYRTYSRLMGCLMLPYVFAVDFFLIGLLSERWWMCIPSLILVICLTGTGILITFRFRRKKPEEPNSSEFS